MIDCTWPCAVNPFKWRLQARFAFDHEALLPHSQLRIVVNKPATIYRFKWTYGAGNGSRTRKQLSRQILSLFPVPFGYSGKYKRPLFIHVGRLVLGPKLIL